MNYLKYIKSVVLVMTCAIVLTTSTACFDTVTAEPVSAPSQNEQVSTNAITPLAIVANPKAYLNKEVLINAKFDKFSTLGLDYKPAFRSSEDYISFLIKRDDTKYDIPLSEMKLFLKRDLAEKLIDLKTDDEVQIKGTVFSDALGDTWVDAENVIIIKKAPEKDGVK